MPITEDMIVTGYRRTRGFQRIRGLIPKGEAQGPPGVRTGVRAPANLRTLLKSPAAGLREAELLGETDNPVLRSCDSNPSCGIKNIDERQT